MKRDDADGPLQDPVNLTPFDLYWAGVEIEEPVPQYYRFRCMDDGKVGAMHDTPEQAIKHARKMFGIWPNEGEKEQAR